ncbi:MAG: hypothetical protein RLY20_815 [Verrucomicrobiota bacterium]|jgi:hypothetical protein
MQTQIEDPTRRKFLGLLAKLPLVPASMLVAHNVGKMLPPAPRKVLLNDFPIAGFKYYHGPSVHPSLHAGTALHLRAEPGNPYDPHAVEILRGGDKLGYVPRFCNRHLSRLLQAGVSLSCTVGQVNPMQPAWQAVQVRVSLLQAA